MIAELAEGCSFCSFSETRAGPRAHPRSLKTTCNGRRLGRKLRRKCCGDFLRLVSRHDIGFGLRNADRRIRFRRLLRRRRTSRIRHDVRRLLRNRLLGIGRHAPRECREASLCSGQSAAYRPSQSRDERSAKLSRNWIAMKKNSGRRRGAAERQAPACEIELGGATSGAPRRSGSAFDKADIRVCIVSRRLSTQCGNSCWPSDRPPGNFFSGIRPPIERARRSSSRGRPHTVDVVGFARKRAIAGDCQRRRLRTANPVKRERDRLEKPSAGAETTRNSALPPPDHTAANVLKR